MELPRLFRTSTEDLMEMKLALVDRGPLTIGVCGMSFTFMSNTKAVNQWHIRVKEYDLKMKEQLLTFTADLSILHKELGDAFPVEANEVRDHLLTQVTDDINNVGQEVHLGPYIHKEFIRSILSRSGAVEDRERNIIESVENEASLLRRRGYPRLVMGIVLLLLSFACYLTDLHVRHWVTDLFWHLLLFMSVYVLSAEAVYYIEQQDKQKEPKAHLFRTSYIETEIFNLLPQSNPL